MTPAPDSPLKLTLAPRGKRQGPLYPEQTADFDLVLHNGGRAAVQVKALEGNLDSPVIRIFDSKGAIGQFSKYDMGARMVGDVSTLSQPSAQMVALPAGGQAATWVNLWSFLDPLPPGRYSVDAVHTTTENGPAVTSERLPFEITPAHVADAALSYDSRNRSQTELAWLASAAKDQKLRLLLRESGFAGHASLHQGAAPLGEFEPGSRVSLSQLAWDAPIMPVAWVAVFEPDGKATAIQHSATFEQTRVNGIQLGVRNPVPVPRFPDRRQHAVILATGQSQGGPAIAGAVVGAGEARPWVARIPELPTLAACAALTAGPIHILLVTDDGKQSRVRRLALDEQGKIVTPETTVRTTPNAIVALAVGQRTAQASFLLLEADRIRHNRMVLLRVAVTGEMRPTDLGQLAGWPIVPGPESARPEPPRAIQMEQGTDGSVWIAMINERGNLYCGKADGSLVLLDGEKQPPSLLFPHIAALKNGGTCAAFTSDGLIYHPGAGHQH